MESDGHEEDLLAEGMQFDDDFLCYTSLFI